MGQKAKKITDKQYQHARKMAFAKSIDGLPKKVAQWVDDSVLLGSRYLFTHRENGVRYGHCTHCHKDVVLELGRTFTPADERCAEDVPRELLRRELPALRCFRSGSGTV